MENLCNRLNFLFRFLMNLLVLACQKSENHNTEEVSVVEVCEIRIFQAQSGPKETLKFWSEQNAKSLLVLPFFFRFQPFRFNGAFKADLLNCLPIINVFFFADFLDLPVGKFISLLPTRPDPLEKSILVCQPDLLEKSSLICLASPDLQSICTQSFSVLIQQMITLEQSVVM